MVTLPRLSFVQDFANGTAKQAEVITFKAFPENLELLVSIGTFTNNDLNDLSSKKNIALLSIMT
ncbi:hypothetical protein ES711_09245 [Gelidibacter salicanalis]|uniref:Uncharacterized protein n=1 Tax=Gelidibacter salicanalis TaxID=291193 RepID=A0A5C7AJR1_9FLAO|nr:hypothetical protein [Gelidibacter salicanalis]TXE08671.1 hypothetical protein ES711_09245 [Gelidibacter salicanalis]